MNKSGEAQFFKEAKSTENSFLEELRHEYPEVSTFYFQNFIKDSNMTGIILKMSTWFDVGGWMKTM